MKGDKFNVKVGVMHFPYVSKGGGLDNKLFSLYGCMKLSEFNRAIGNFKE